MSLHLIDSTPAAGVLLPLVTETEAPSSSLLSPTELILLLLKRSKSGENVGGGGRKGQRDRKTPIWLWGDNSEIRVGSRQVGFLRAQYL